MCCIFSLSRRYLLSAQMDTVYARGEKHSKSNPGAAQWRRNPPAAVQEASHSRELRQTRGDVGFKRWVRSLQTSYHCRQTRGICEIQNVHFRNTTHHFNAILNLQHCETVLQSHTLSAEFKYEAGKRRKVQKYFLFLKLKKIKKF